MLDKCEMFTKVKMREVETIEHFNKAMQHEFLIIGNRNTMLCFGIE